MAKFCSFNLSSGSVCGPSRGLEEYVKLSSCNDDICAHLLKCHLSRECVSERDLILARSGMLDLSESQLDEMIICPKHRHSLGQFWRPLKTCQHPLHSGKQSTLKADSHVFNFKLMREVKTIFGRIIPVGSREYLDFFQAVA